MKNAEWMIKNGYKFSDIHYCFAISHNAVNFYLNGEIIGNALGTSYLAAFTEWLDQERNEPILTDEERTYLSYVIKPFRDRVKYIEKIYVDHLYDEPDYYICIKFNDGNDDMKFPSFDESHTYKCMEEDRAYTLDELGL